MSIRALVSFADKQAALQWWSLSMVLNETPLSLRDLNSIFFSHTIFNL